MSSTLQLSARTRYYTGRKKSCAYADRALCRDWLWLKTSGVIHLRQQRDGEFVIVDTHQYGVYEALCE
jgi:hypothetical protein